MPSSLIKAALTAEADTVRYKYRSSPSLDRLKRVDYSDNVLVPGTLLHIRQSRRKHASRS